MDQKASIPANEPAEPFHIGAFRIDPRRNVIQSGESETTIEPKIMAVLVLLARHAGEVVTRRRLIDTIWATEFGGDESLTRAISHLRKALGDGRGGEARIETIPKRGYRLVAAPTSCADDVAARAGPRIMTDRRAIATVVIGLICVGLALAFNVLRQAPPARADSVIDGSKVVLAVLPFDNLCDDPEAEALAEGLADDILASLTRSNAVAVIAGGSSFRFRGKDKDPAAVAKALGVTHVVDGTLRREAGRVRVNAYLVDASSKLVAWSILEEGAANDMFRIRNAVSFGVLSALGKAASNAKTPDSAPSARAYELYLRGRALMRDRAAQSLTRGIEYLTQAVEADPDFADGWATLAMARLNYALNLVTDPPGEIEKARLAAGRALALDPASVEAMLALAIADYREDAVAISVTEQRFRQAVDAAPKDANAVLRMGLLLNEMGRTKEAAEMFKRAFDLDPISTNTANAYVTSLLLAGRISEADAIVEQDTRGLFINPFNVWSCKYSMFLSRGDFARAKRWAEDWRPNTSETPEHYERVRELYAKVADVLSKSDPQAAQIIRDELLEAVRTGTFRYFLAFRLLAAAGYDEPATDLALDRIRSGDRWFRSVLFEPGLEGFRRNPRILDIFEENGLLDYWTTTDNWPDFCADEDLPYDCREEAAARAARR